MRIAVFSDIHANLPALDAIAAHLAHDVFDQVICLGDLGGYASQPNEVQQFIESMGCPTLLGNYDENVGFDRDDCGCHYVKPFDIEMSRASFDWTRSNTSVENKSKLRDLPRTIRLEAAGHRILFCHGSPRSNTEYLFENRSNGYLNQFAQRGQHNADADIIVFGHTHVPYHRVVSDVHFVNAGSVGRPKDGDPRAGYVVLDIRPNELKTEFNRVEYDVEETCRLLLAAGLPNYFAEYLRTGGMIPEPLTHD